MEEELPEQHDSSTHKALEDAKKEHRLAPYQWKKGQSGNPKGRTPGKSAKERAQRMLESMTDDEFEDFLHGIDKRTIWEMAEGKAKQDMNLRGTLTISQVLDGLENGQTPTE